MTDYARWDKVAAELSDSDDEGEKFRDSVRQQLEREDVWEAQEGVTIVDAMGNEISGPPEEHHLSKGEGADTATGTDADPGDSVVAASGAGSDGVGSGGSAHEHDADTDMAGPDTDDSGVTIDDGSDTTAPTSDDGAGARSSDSAAAPGQATTAASARTITSPASSVSTSPVPHDAPARKTAPVPAPLPAAPPRAHVSDKSALPPRRVSSGELLDADAYDAGDWGSSRRDSSGLLVDPVSPAGGHASLHAPMDDDGSSVGGDSDDTIRDSSDDEMNEEERRERSEALMTGLVEASNVHLGGVEEGDEEDDDADEEDMGSRGAGAAADARGVVGGATLDVPAAEAGSGADVGCGAGGVTPVPAHTDSAAATPVELAEPMPHGAADFGRTSQLWRPVSDCTKRHAGPSSARQVFGEGDGVLHGGDARARDLFAGRDVRPHLRSGNGPLRVLLADMSDVGHVLATVDAHVDALVDSTLRSTAAASSGVTRSHAVEFSLNSTSPFSLARAVVMLCAAAAPARPTGAHDALFHERSASNESPVRPAGDSGSPTSSAGGAAADGKPAAGAATRSAFSADAFSGSVDEEEAAAAFMLCLWGSAGLTRSQRHRLNSILDVLIAASEEPCTFESLPFTSWIHLADSPLCTAGAGVEGERSVKAALDRWHFHATILRRYWQSWRDCDTPLADVQRDRHQYALATSGGGASSSSSAAMGAAADPAANLAVMRAEQWLGLAAESQKAQRELDAFSRDGCLPLPRDLSTYVPPLPHHARASSDAGAAAGAGGTADLGDDDDTAPYVTNPTQLALVHASATTMAPLRLESRGSFASLVYQTVRPVSADREAAEKRRKGGGTRLFDPALAAVARQLVSLRRAVWAGAVKVELVHHDVVRHARAHPNSNSLSTFHVIDTASMADCSGLLNVVATLSPLLASTPDLPGRLLAEVRRWQGAPRRRGPQRTLAEFVEVALPVPSSMMPTVLGVHWANADDLVRDTSPERRGAAASGIAFGADEWDDVLYAAGGPQPSRALRSVTFVFDAVNGPAAAPVPLTLRWADDSGEVAARAESGEGDDADDSGGDSEEEDNGGQDAVVSCLRDIARLALDAKAGALRYVGPDEAAALDTPAVTMLTLIDVIRGMVPRLRNAAGLLAHILAPLPPHFVRPHLLQVNALCALQPPSVRPLLDLSPFSEFAGNVVQGGFAGFAGIGTVDGAGATMLCVSVRDVLTPDMGRALLDGSYVGGVDVVLATTDDVPTQQSMLDKGELPAYAHELRQWLGFYARVGHVHMMSNARVDRAGDIVVDVWLPTAFAAKVQDASSGQFCAMLLIDHYTKMPLCWPLRVDAGAADDAAPRAIDRCKPQWVLQPQFEDPPAAAWTTRAVHGVSDPSPLLDSFVEQSAKFSAVVRFPESAPTDVRPRVRYPNPAAIEYTFPAGSDGSGGNGAGVAGAGVAGGGVAGAGTREPMASGNDTAGEVVVRVQLPCRVVRKHVKTQVSRSRRVLMPQLPKAMPTAVSRLHLATLRPWAAGVRLDAPQFDLNRRMFSAAEISASQASEEGVAFGHDPFLDLRQTLLGILQIAQDDLGCVHVITSDTGKDGFFVFVRALLEAPNGEPLAQVAYHRVAHRDRATSEQASKTERMERLLSTGDRSTNEITGSQAEMALLARVLHRNATRVARTTPDEVGGVELVTSFLVPMYPQEATRKQARVRSDVSEAMLRAGATGGGGATSTAALAASAGDVGAGDGDGDTDGGMTGSSSGCIACGTVKPNLMVCSRCHGAKFCDRACQRKAWKQHKRACKMMAMFNTHK